MALHQKQPDSFSSVEEQAAWLDQAYGHLSAGEIVRISIEKLFPGSIGAVSSFGADSAALLKLIADADADTPVMFLDTGQHFGETLDYRDELAADLGLSNLKIIHPQGDALTRFDPADDLHKTDTDQCCDIRKVEPMARAVAPFDAWFTGRKRYQNAQRADMPVFEAVGPRIRINPLARWTTEDQANFMRENDLRQNPLVAFGYLSIGCFPCTQPVSDGDERSGRWAGQSKTECGIHLEGLVAIDGRGDVMSDNTRIWNGEAFVESEWVEAESVEALVKARPAILPLTAWQALDDERKDAHGAPIGVRIEPGEDMAAVLDDLDDLPLIALSFPAYTDGRAYSTAVRLRRAGFQGSLRAVGDVLYDQVDHMIRTGFSELEISNEPTLAKLEKGELPGIAQRYQPSLDDEQATNRFAWRRFAA